MPILYSYLATALFPFGAALFSCVSAQKVTSKSELFSKLLCLLAEIIKVLSLSK